MLIINNGNDLYIAFTLAMSCHIYFLLLCPLRRLLNKCCWLWTLRNQDKAILFISFVSNCTTRWFKYDRDWFVQTYTQIVPVIFEPPCIILAYASGTFNVASVSRRITEKIQLYSNTTKKIYLWYRRIWSLMGFPDNRCLRSSISGSTLLIWTSKYMLRYTLYIHAKHDYILQMDKEEFLWKGWNLWLHKLNVITMRIFQWELSLPKIHLKIWFLELTPFTEFLET